MVIPRVPGRPGRLLIPIFILVACLSTLFAATLSAQETTETDDQATLEAHKATNPPLSSAASARVYRSIQAPDELFAGIDNATIPYSSYLADTATGTWNPYIGGVEFWGAAYDPASDILYFSEGAGFSKVEGGAVVEIGTFTYQGDTASIIGMAWYDGILYGTRGVTLEGVFSIDTSTGELTLVAAVDPLVADLGGVAADPDTGALYATNDDADLRGLVEVDLTTGDLTLVAPYPAGETDIDGLAFHDGRAYLIEDDSSASGLVYVYDVTAGEYVDEFPTPWEKDEIFAAGAWVGEGDPGGPTPTPSTTPTVATPTVTSTPEPGACTWGDWGYVAPVNVARSRPGLAYLPSTGRFYLTGGEATGGNRAIPIEEYDPATNTWTERAFLEIGVSNTGAVGVGDYVYVPGGLSAPGVQQDVLQRYAPITDTVTLMAPMPTTNAAHAVTELGGRIYVVGGTPDGLSGTTNYIYDIATDSWTTGAPLPVAVQFPAAASDGEFVYVLGGTVSNLDTVQIYDPTTDTWTLGPPLNEGRGGPGAFYDGVNVWVVGGGWSTFSVTTEYWDGTSWQFGPELNTGVRTLGAAFGEGIALKAAGWSGGYEDDAEVLAIDCTGGPTPTPTATGVNPTPTNTAVPPTPTATGGATSIRLGTLEGSGTSIPWLLLALAGIAGLAGAVWQGARRR